MKFNHFTLLFTAFISNIICNAQVLPAADEVLKTAQLVNKYFMQKYSDYTATSNVRGVTRPSNIWTRGVYYEGLMALYEIAPADAYYKYAHDWAQFHKWNFRHGITTRNADDYCAAQTYIDLYRLKPGENDLSSTLALSNLLLSLNDNGDWTWIDAIQMGMPVLAKMGVTMKEPRYFDKMWKMYKTTRNDIGGGLFNVEEGLWWRDADFVPPYKEPNGANCYWSRGNGWVYANYVRIINEIPETESHRGTYIADFLLMSQALAKCQRSDGFWNVSLHCEENYGGKETTGTALFVYGMAWGIRKGLLERAKYLPIVLKAWNAMVRDAVHSDGFLGYVQGTGKEPKDSQPVTYDSVPDFEDFGVGCFLLAATEVYRLAQE